MIPTVTRVLDPTVPLRIIVIDSIDGDGFARRLAEASDATLRVVVVGIAATAHDGPQLVDELGPDVVVIGTTLPDRPGIEAIQEIRLVSRSVPVISLTTTESNNEFFAVLVAGASAYVAHDVQNTRLLDRIRRSAMGDYPINDLSV